MLEAAKGCDRAVAIGLGGPEDAWPPAPFAELFAEARVRGLRSTPHAGEDAGPESVRAAIAALKADRIAHGVRSIEDPTLLAELAASRLPLDVALTSNVMLGVATTVDAHPLKALWDAGALVTINTDDPGFFACDLTGEYALAGRLLDLDRPGYAQLARNSVEASFAPATLRAEMLAGIAEWEA
jgi:adenosine deaminase